MTVKELIAILSQFDPTLPVYKVSRHYPEEEGRCDWTTEHDIESYEITVEPVSKYSRKLKVLI